MELTLGSDLQPGPDALTPARIASLATSPAGLLGLLDLLETALGLRAPLPSETEQITTLLPALQTTCGYWSRSLTADAWGTARRLLRDLAALTLEGWAGQPISDRYTALWQVTRGTGLTQGERWQAVTAALRDRPTTPLRTLNLLDPLHTWPGSIRRTLEQLAAVGTQLRDWTPAPSNPATPASCADSSRTSPAAPRVRTPSWPPPSPEVPPPSWPDAPAPACLRGPHHGRPSARRGPHRHRQRRVRCPGGDVRVRAGALPMLGR